MVNKEKPVDAGTKVSSSNYIKPRIRVKRLNAKESKEHSVRMGLPTSCVVISNRIIGGRK